MYEYQNNILSIPARLLYEDWNLFSYQNYLNLGKRGKLIRTKEGRGAGNEAWVSFKDLPRDIKAICIEKLGKPEEVAVKNKLLDYIVPDTAAVRFFAEHRKPNGQSLDFDKQREKATNCMILNAIQTVFKDSKVQARVFGRMKTKIWQNVSEAVNAIDPEEYVHSLPGNPRRLQQKFTEYKRESYGTFIHKGEGHENTVKIKGDIADFLLAMYGLPIKMSVPQLWAEYERKRQQMDDWPSITESGIAHWLNEPKQERIWILARDGKDAWRRKYANSIDRDRSKWFPNAYWAIDGSKIDWVHYDDDSSNKRAARLKINPLIDAYSEKIIGWSFSETENHLDHIKAINMALNEAQCRPYLMTYDAQSGHRMKRMQELYDNVVARDGGTHYKHKVGQKSNPMEQVFNRLQQQVINMWWFSDKQSVKVRTSRNKMNEDFIADNTHNLPTKAELEKAWQICVDEWNNAKHPHYNKTRAQVYDEQMPFSEPISLLEIVSVAWVAETKPITYTREGLTMSLGDSKFKFEVYDYDNNIDLEFRRVNIGKKFIVRYNPDHLDNYVQLYERGANDEMIFSAVAQPKRKHETIPVLMDDNAKAQWWKDFKTQQEEFERDQKDYKAIAERTGITREKLIQDQELKLKMAGHISKTERAMAEEYDF